MIQLLSILIIIFTIFSVTFFSVWIGCKMPKIVVDINQTIAWLFCLAILFILSLNIIGIMPVIIVFGGYLVAIPMAYILTLSISKLSKSFGATNSTELLIFEFTFSAISALSTFFATIVLVMMFIERASNL